MSNRWEIYIRARLPNLRIDPARETEILAELALQLEQAHRDAVAAGASDQEALRQAEAQFGDWNQLARQIEAAGHRHIDPPAQAGPLFGALYDFRYAVRFFLRNPAFTAVAVLTLAFGIGANTAVFTMLDALVFHALPYSEPDRLMAIETQKDQAGVDPWTSALDFFDLRDRARAFSTLAGISPVWDVILTGSGDAERLQALYVSSTFFPTLGVDAALGRTFLASEDRGTEPSNVIILSNGGYSAAASARPAISSANPCPSMASPTPSSESSHPVSTTSGSPSLEPPARSTPGSRSPRIHSRAHHVRCDS